MATPTHHTDPAPAPESVGFAGALAISVLAHAGIVLGSVWLLGRSPAQVVAGTPAVASIPRQPTEPPFQPIELEPRQPVEPLPEPEPRLSPRQAEPEPEDPDPVPESLGPLPDWSRALAAVPPQALRDPVPPEPEREPASPPPAAAPEPPPPEPVAATDQPAEPPSPASDASAHESQEATFLACPKPSYPRVSLRLGEEGTVLCRLAIDEDGRVTAVEVVRSSGHERLDRAAREALLKWRFHPARRAGRPVASTLDHAVEFRLTRAP